MFIGHYGIALAAKKIEPKLNLGILFMATQIIDLIWPVFVLIGWEKVSALPERIGISALNFESYPISHSLLGTVFWSLLIALAFHLRSKNLRASLILFAVALSHWFLDPLVHEKDLPLSTDQSPKLGFELWQHPAISITLESLIFFAGLAAFLSLKSLRTRAQKISFASMMVFLVVIYILNVFGPPPPPDATSAMIAGPALLLWIFVFWAYKTDRKPAQ